MPRIMLKSPEEYQRELELYKQLKNNVYTIFKTPEIERQTLVQQLKLESEAKDTARELSRIQQETKERPQSLSVDDEEYLRLFNTINTLLNDGEDLFNITALQAMNKDELEDTKDLLQKIKKQDIGSGNMEKTRYINKSINLINQRLNSKITTKKSVIKPKEDLGAVGGDGEGEKEEEKQSKSVAVSESVSLPIDIQKIINSPVYVQKPKKLKDLTDDELKTVSEDIDLYFNILKQSDLDSSIKNKIKQRLNGRKKAVREISSRRTIGLGLSVWDLPEFRNELKKHSRADIRQMGYGMENKDKKSKSKTKATPKSKSELGKQEQIYYILSKKAGNNNKLMKKRLSKK